MKVKVFSIPANGDEQAEASINEFLASHRIAQVDRQLVNNGAGSFWTVCVGYWNTDETAAISASRKVRIDYRKVLDETRFREYAALREWRKKVAETEGIPIFTIFTNEQLASIVSLESVSSAAVADIQGIGKGKLEQYVPEIIEELVRHRQANGNASA